MTVALVPHFRCQCIAVAVSVGALPHTFEDRGLDKTAVVGWAVEIVAPADAAVAATTGLVQFNAHPRSRLAVERAYVAYRAAHITRFVARQRADPQCCAVFGLRHQMITNANPGGEQTGIDACCARLRSLPVHHAACLLIVRR